MSSDFEIKSKLFILSGIGYGQWFDDAEKRLETEDRERLITSIHCFNFPQMLVTCIYPSTLVPCRYVGCRGKDQEALRATISLVAVLKNLWDDENERSRSILR